MNKAGYKLNILNLYWLIFISLLLFTIDRVVKSGAKEHHFFITNNYYILGLADFNWIILPLILLLISAFTLIRIKKHFIVNLLGFCLIVAGSVSNILDRLIYHGVIDYLKITFFNIRLDFNLADIYVLVGVIIYVWNIIKKDYN